MLLLTKNCTVCGETTPVAADPYLMVRLCAECREVKLAELVGRTNHGTGPQKLVCVTTIKFQVMTFRKKNAEKRPRGSGSLRYCLGKELAEVQATYRELNQPGCEVAFARWTTEVKDELNLRKEFAHRLRAFLRLVENTRYNELEKIKRERSNEINKRLLALGYIETGFKIHYSLSNKWRALVEQPKALSNRVWENLLSRLTPLLEANKAQAEEDAKASRKTKRQAELHRLLREFKLETHPLAGMVKALGYEPKLPEPMLSNAATSGANATPACVARFLNTYPFPDTYTALDWAFFKDITSNDISLEDVKALFDAHRKEVEEQAGEWRTRVECALTQKVLLDESLPPLSDVVKVNGSTLTQLLLCVDAVFTTSKNTTYDDQLLHYPFFIPTNDKFWSYGWSQTISVEQHTFNAKACEAARALLKDLGKSDASGLEMDSAGKVFRCGRCAFMRPVNWEGIGQIGSHLESVHGVLLGEPSVLLGLVSDCGTFRENGGAWRARWDEYYDESEKTRRPDLDEDADGALSSDED